MQNYRTPIRIHASCTRKTNSKIARYRLPFRKDEPIQDKQYSLNTLNDQKWMITSQIISRNLQKSRLASRVDVKDSGELSKKEQITSDKGQDLIKQSPMPEPLSSEKAQKSTSIQQFSLNYKEKHEQFQQQERKNSVRQISNIKPRIFYEDIAIKKKPIVRCEKPSTEEENNLADRSVQSDAENNVYLKKKGMQTQAKEDALPIIKQRNRRTLNASLKKEEMRAWHSLSQQLNDFRADSLKKDLRKKKKKSNHLKSSSSVCRIENQQNQCLAIEAQLKRLNKDKTGIDLQMKQDFYVDLPAIIEDQPQNPKTKQRNNAFIEKLRQATESEQHKKQKKTKTKYPLQYYLQNYYKIRQVNPFFRKLNELGGCIMLSIGRLKIFQSGSKIYNQGQPLTHMYINVLGKILLSNGHKSFKKFSLSGQTLSQQALFQQGKTYNERLARGSRPMFHRQQAKALSRVCVLKIKLQKYYKASNQLCAIGYKNMFVLIDNLFRINYYKKQSLHTHSQLKDRIQTEIMLNKKYKDIQFFH